MTTKKFWCHYIGNDGNTPKRRSIELTDIHDILPNVSNEGARTPLWAERVEDEYNQIYFNLYAQLSDTVAVRIIGGYLSSQMVARLSETDEEIEARERERKETDLADYPKMSEERKAELSEHYDRMIEETKRERDRNLALIVVMQDYDSLLLSGSRRAWIANATLRAYEESGSPILSRLKELRAIAMKEREREQAERRDAERKRKEEAEHKRKEEAKREQERLTREEENFRNGKSISGCDVVDLCRRHGIYIHLRTVHNLQQVIHSINGKNGSCEYRRARGKRRPSLDGCFKTARTLYRYLEDLNTNE